MFGFRTGEIRKLYLNANFYVIAVGAAICIPLAKFIMDRVYPYLASNVACGINLEFNWKLYLLIYLGIILCYLIINQLLIRNVKKID
ncbi:FtsX-like permease family protein [Asaccharospora irregularis]|uniref:FtsX-like permease family protein n=1 Tax=Asaccharospora irregularis TaxID=29359 RepID=UPI0009FF9B72